MIWIDGQPYLKINNMEIRQKIAYVPQEPYLFNDSIKENIRIGKLNATDEEIEKNNRTTFKVLQNWKILPKDITFEEWIKAGNPLNY